VFLAGQVRRLYASWGLGWTQRTRCGATRGTSWESFGTRNSRWSRPVRSSAEPVARVRLVVDEAQVQAAQLLPQACVADATLVGHGPATNLHPEHRPVPRRAFGEVAVRVGARRPVIGGGILDPVAQTTAVLRCGGGRCLARAMTVRRSCRLWGSCGFRGWQTSGMVLGADARPTQLAGFALVHSPTTSVAGQRGVRPRPLGPSRGFSNRRARGGGDRAGGKGREGL
jgi:hypothetical protein